MSPCLHLWLHGFDGSKPRQDDRRFLLRQTLCEADPEGL
jgi:hypothetical protein